MSSHVTFRNHRLYVGWRREDWTGVWYEPMRDVGDEDEDGAMPFGLYSSPTSTQAREPMEREVAWIAQFNPANMEADARKVRERMQNIDLHNAWKYLDEQDVEKVERLEEELNNPLKRRWQSWFEQAKRFKHAKMKERRSRQTKKELKLRLIAAGVDRALFADDLLTDEDSAYESDGEPFVAQSARAKSMGPPGPKTTNKRAAHNANGAARKRVRPTTGAGRSASGTVRSAPGAGRRGGGFTMSGGAGDGAVRGRQAFLDDLVRDRQSPAQTPDFDTGSPEPNLPMSAYVEDDTEAEEERHERIAGYRSGLPVSPDSELAQRINGDVADERTAVQRAITESQANANDGFDPEQIELARQESMRPESRPGVNE